MSVSKSAYNVDCFPCDLFYLDMTWPNSCTAIEIECISTTQSAAPMENGDLIIRLSFPTNLKLNFNAEKNLEGAALCIDGMVTKPVF